MTEPDIAHVVKEIWGARVSSTKVILAQIRDVAVPSKIVSIFWDLKFNFSSPFRIVDVGFYLTKNFFYYRIGNSLYSQGDSEPTFYNGYLFNNRRKMDARQSTSYLPPITGPINQAVKDYSAFSFTYNYPQQYQLASHESKATETPTTSRTNFSCVCLLVKTASKTVTRSIFFCILRWLISFVNHV